MSATIVESLAAVCLEEIHRWDETAIIRCESRESKNGDDAEIINVKVADCDPGEIENGLPYVFFGRWQEYRRKKSKWDKSNGAPEVEMQFHAKTWRREKPYEKNGVIKWLKAAPGIGIAVATKLWGLYGPDAIQRVKESPEQAAEEIGGGFTAEKAKMASAHLRENDAMEAAFVDLESLFDARGFPKKLPKSLVKDFGADAAQVLRKNPWPLLRYPRTGIARVDKLYCDLAKAKGPAAYKAAISSTKRQTIILQHCLQTANNGSTWLTEEAAREVLGGRIAGAEVKFQKAVRLGVRSGLIANRWDGDFKEWISAGDMAEDERYIAERAARINESDPPFQWPDVSTLNISDHQQSVLSENLVARWVILGGWPGSGKTFSLARLIAAMANMVGLHNIAACCFTGKAASRLSEVLFEAAVKVRATTIHSLLSGGKASEAEGWKFSHNEDNPLPYRLIVIDEASMLGTGLFATLLRAIDQSAQIIIAGDYRQLPPIEHGRPLFDMIEAGVPYAEFKEVRRNSGTGVLACRSIMEGTFNHFQFDKTFQLKPDPNDPTSPHNCKHIATKSNGESVEEIVKYLHMLRGKNIPVNLKNPDGEKRPIDLTRDSVVIVATNGDKAGKSELSRSEINKRLQRELNPHGRQFAGSPFRDGDRIICLKNGSMPVVEEDSRYYDSSANIPGECDFNDSGDKVRVQNGELGAVIGQEEKIVYARFESPLRVLKIPRGKPQEADSDSGDDDSKTNTGCNFDLGYAITAHKCQGSQFAIVLFGIDETSGARMVLSMEAVWTILSRFQWLQVLFGKRAVLNGYCKRFALKPRKTFLADEIRERIERLKYERVS